MKKIIILLILPFALQAQKDYPALLDAYMQAAVNVNQFTGSVLIGKHDHIIYQKTFGTLDYANTKPLDESSMFELGNITEEFTAAAILLLKDKGKLKLTDPITKYLPELPYNTITIKDLLTHTSGLPDYYDEGMKDKWGTKKLATNADVIKSLAEVKAPLALEPGKKHDAYLCYTEYPLLAAIIEKISGLSYKTFMQQNIFTPLHLNRTNVFTELQATKKLHPNHTESVAFSEPQQKFLPGDSNNMPLEYHYITEAVVGETGISSTAHDLFVFSRALKSKGLLSSSTQKEMFTPYELEDSVNNIFFGYGVLTGNNELGRYIQQRDDGNNTTLGYVTSVINYSLEDYTIIVLANKAKSTSIVTGPLSYILFNREVIAPYIHQQVAIDTTLLDNYVGEYKVSRVAKVYKKDGTLWTTITGEPDLKLLPESPTKFFSSDKEYDWQIEFKTDASGKVLQTFFIFSGLKKEAKKL